MKQYLLSVVSAAIISGMVTKLLGSKGTQGAIGKLVAGLFLAFTIISPLRTVRIGELTGFAAPYSAAAQYAVEEGKNQTAEALRTGIKQACEAYIFDKAQSWNAELEVEVTVSREEVPAPTGIRLSGHVSPGAKAKLTAIITEDLGIPKEAQKWN